MMLEGKVGAVIVAAGSSQRMGGIDKVFASVCGRPMLAWTLDVFEAAEVIDEIVVVLSGENLSRGRALLLEYGWTKVAAVCAGGGRRQDSVREGLARLTDCRWVAIHDGARPMVSPDVIERGIDEAIEYGAVVAAVPVTDTIKTMTSDGFVGDTPQREFLQAVQTPQVFDFDLIFSAHAQVTDDVTDDAMMVERLGHRVRLYPGSYDNIKVTTPDDLALAEFLLQKRGRVS